MADMDEKQIQKLLNAHKLGQIITPLAEAVEINRHTGSIEGLSVSTLFDEVLNASGAIYESAMDDGGALPDMSDISDSIFVILSKALRNNTVVFNNPSLQMLQEDITGLLKKHHGFIVNFLNKNNEGKSLKLVIQGETTSAIMALYIPMWRFHLSLYVAGFIGNEKLSELNTTVAAFLLDIIKTIMGKKSHRDMTSKAMNTHYFKLCTELIGLSLHDYQTKLIKNKDKLKAYIQTPEALINKLVPVIYAHFMTFESGVDEAMKHLDV